MEQTRAAERALVSALVLGQVDRAELRGLVRVSDFGDPAAGLIFEVATQAPAGSLEALPRLLSARGALRSDGYPVSHLLEWLPTVPVPVHPHAWGALVVAGALSRLVDQSGVRLVQASDTADRAGGVARVLAVAAAQRAALHGACRRWQDLPARWRASVPTGLSAATPAPEPTGGDRWAGPSVREIESELLAGVVAAPRQLDRLTWLRAGDFAGRDCGQLFDAARRLHDAGRPVDLVTLAASFPPPGAPAQPGQLPAVEPAQMCAELRPHTSVPAWVPVLARQVLSAAVLREAEQTGHRLMWLASGRAGVGLGRPMLERALTRIDELGEPAARWQQSRDPLGAPPSSSDRPRTREQSGLVRPGRMSTQRAARDRRGPDLDRTG